MIPAIALRRISVVILVLLTLAHFGLAQGAASPAAEKPVSKVTYLLVGRLFDATGDNVRENMVIAVEDERIKSVASAADLKIPPGANVIDLSQQTVLPGLIDCHTHLGSRADRYYEIYDFKSTPFDHAFSGVVNARKTLEAGFTSVRDVGSEPFLAVDLRNSINEGYLVGPRIVASGPGISITGGHGDLNNYSPQTRVMMFPEERDFGIADSADQIRHVIRAQEKYGVDVIKILATGGVLSRGDSPGAAQFTFRKAFQAGVKMAFGTDAGVYPHGDNAKQFFYMVKFGMTPSQAIRAATANAADLIGRSKDVGTIEAGKYADIIAVGADPMSDVRALEHVDFVMKGGVVYKDTRSSAVHAGTN